MPKEYDFSKIEDQKEFAELSDADKAEVSGKSQEELGAVKNKIGELINRLSWGRSDIDNSIFLKIRADFNLSEDSIIYFPGVQEAARKGFIKLFSNGHIDQAIYVKNQFKLPDSILSKEFKESGYKLFVYCLSTGDLIYAYKYKDELLLPDSVFLDSEAREAAKKGIFISLRNREVAYSIQLNNDFSLKISLEKIIDAIPGFKDFLEDIKKIVPEFYAQAIKSEDIIIELSSFRKILRSGYDIERFISIVETCPFLVDAIKANSRFGMKLFVEFQDFDELSKENIKSLFEAKKEILTAHPDIDPESIEFRQLMQEKLKEHENNSNILKSMEENGVDLEQWLDYSETSYFSLESGGSVVAFSETISTPITRIRETLDSYIYQIKEILGQYRAELSAYGIPLEDSKEIEERISKMRTEMERYRSEGNEEKVTGIQKGIDALGRKLENIKTIPLWDKLLGDISSFTVLKEDVVKAHDNLVNAENDLHKKFSEKSPPGKAIQEIKERISKAKEELQMKFGLLEERIENFRKNLPKLLSQCLGEERTAALIQEIEQKMAEQFDHYNTDRTTLANLFSERGDKEKEKLESRPMSIFIWARNPDIDLYQGNYSPCCICIDSEHMGAECTIADYATDLGVQVVNIWDETKDEPVTAAWCWLSQDGEGNPILVVDNIESNTLYSTNYPEQLTKELFDYLKNYARAIGAKKVVLGKANNDLPTGGELAKLKDDDGLYGKTGGYNRVDGYFLEAEQNKVKIIWDGKESPKPKKEKKEKRVKPVEFSGLNVKNLSSDDLQRIKELERKIYANTDLISGQGMIEDIKKQNGLEYSLTLGGKRAGQTEEETVGYIVAVEDETDEGDKSVYLEDIAVLPEAQRQGIGWDLLKGLIQKLKEKSAKESKPVLLDMHLRENSQRFMERNRALLEEMGVKLIEEALVPDYFDEGEDALYQVYEVR